MSIRLSRPFRASVASVRPVIEDERERVVFDLLCAAGELAYRLPDDHVSLRTVAGAKDPRRRLAREFSRRGPGPTAGRGDAWRRAGRRLARRLEPMIAARGGDELRGLRALLGYAPTGLAPDCVVPADPLMRVAWETIVRLLARLFRSQVRSLGRPACLDAALLARLNREAAPGLRVGRTASGRRPGPDGRALAVDPALARLVSRALGRRLAPGYQAKFLYYTRAGDHIWPHPDDPRYAVALLLCIDRTLPLRSASGSAFLAYRPDGSVKRYELEVGSALAMESGLVHAREPVRDGEHVVLFSILYCEAASRR